MGIGDTTGICTIFILLSVSEILIRFYIFSTYTYNNMMVFFYVKVLAFWTVEKSPVSHFDKIPEAGSLYYIIGFQTFHFVKIFHYFSIISFMVEI
jgi:hypothetical protein